MGCVDRGKRLTKSQLKEVLHADTSFEHSNGGRLADLTSIFTLTREEWKGARYPKKRMNQVRSRTARCYSVFILQTIEFYVIITRPILHVGIIGQYSNCLWNFSHSSLSSFQSHLHHFLPYTHPRHENPSFRG